MMEITEVSKIYSIGEIPNLIMASHVSTEFFSPTFSLRCALMPMWTLNVAVEPPIGALLELVAVPQSIFEDAHAGIDRRDLNLKDIVESHSSRFSR